MTKATYYFIAVHDQPDLETTSGHHDVHSAFLAIKKEDQDNYFRFKKYERGELPPAGYSLFDIAFGVSVAYRRVPEES